MKPFDSVLLMMIVLACAPAALTLLLFSCFADPNLLCVALAVLTIGVAALVAWHYAGRLTMQVQQLYNASRRDDLTGLFKRGTFEELVERQLQHGVTGTALFILDVDHFRAYNERYGHQRGDELLLNLANELRVTFREQAVIARIGSNTFMILAQGLDDPRACQEMLEQLCYTICRQAMISLSAGICFAREGDQFGTLLDRAERTLSRAKRAGKNRYYLGPDDEVILF